MAEDLSAYIKLYEEKVDSAISKRQKHLDKSLAKREEYNALYPKMIAGLEGAGIDEATFKELYPEGGGSPGAFDPRLTDIFGANDEEYFPIKKFDKIADSPQQVENATYNLEEAKGWKGKGEAYLNTVHTGLNSQIKSENDWNDLVGFIDKYLADPEKYGSHNNPIAKRSRQFPDSLGLSGPSGIISSSEMALLIKEKGYVAAEPKEEEGKESSAINSDVERDVEQEEGGDLLTSQEEVEEASPDITVSSKPITLPEEAEVEIEESEEASVTESAITSLEPIGEGPGEIAEGEKIEQGGAEVEPQSTVISNVSNTINELGENVQNASPTATSEQVSQTSPINSAEVGSESAISNAISNISESVLSGDTISSLSSSSEANYSTEDISTEGGINNITDTISNLTESVSPDMSSLFNTTNLMGIGEDLLSGGPVGGAISGILGSVKESPFGKGASAAIDKISNFSAPSITELGPGPEPVTNESITQLGDTISSSVMNQSVAGTAEPGVTSQPQQIASSENRSISETPSGTGKGSDTIVSNAGLAEAIGSLRSEMISIKRLLQGPLDVKIKGNR